MSKNKFLVLTILFGVIAFTSLLILVYFINGMITESATTLRIWGTVGFSLVFLIACSLFGVNYTLYTYFKKTSVIKPEVEQEEKQQNDENDFNITQID